MQVDIKAAAFIDSMQGSADWMSPGAVLTNKYQSEIVDMVRRRLPFGQRIKHEPATGQPSRYFEQLSIPTGAFVDPRVLSATASQSKRVERYLTLKGISGQINYSLFDSEVNTIQGQFAYLEAKDLSDLIDGVLKVHDQALWTGSDTDLTYPTTAQYFGVSGQIVRATAVGGVNQVVTIGSSASIVDGIKAQIAQMVARTDFEVRPTSIYMNPILIDKLELETKDQQQFFNESEIAPGVIVKTINTQVGPLPVVPDPSITNLNGNGGLKQYASFIVTDSMIEYHWLTNPLPRVFQLGLLSNLAAQFMVVKFGAVVVKGPAYAHSVILTERA